MLKRFPCPIPAEVKENILNLGVEKRHLLDPDEIRDEKGIVTLCAEACRKTMKEADITSGDINYLVAGYDVNPVLSPGLSQLLAPELDINRYVKYANMQGIASTAFPKALELARDHLCANPKDKVLVCISGVTSYWFQAQVQGMKNLLEIKEINAVGDAKKRQAELKKWVATMQYFLFADGAAAAIITNQDEGLTVTKTVEVTNIRQKDYLAGFTRFTASNEPFKFDFHTHLDREIPKLGVEYTHLALKRLLSAKHRQIIREAKKWAVHTGSAKILSSLAEHNGISPEKLEESYAVLREYGNLAGASLPFILKRILSNTELERDDIVLMLGYGWGFSAAATQLQYRR
jgi:predicted naringenin-chalcone synthase